MKMINTKNVCLFAVVLVFSLSAIGLGPQQLTADQIQQLLLAQPPQAVQALSLALADENGVADPIKVTFVNADLDGSRSFSYFVALYSTDSVPGGFLRVFRRQGAGLESVGDQDVDRQVGGFLSQLELIDVNGDGIPEIKVNSVGADGNDPAFSLFVWSGHSLHDMIGNVTIHSDLVDIQNSGILALIHKREDGDGFDIFQLRGNDYQFFDVIATDPSGFVTAAGNFVYVRAFCSRIEPDEFSLHAIRESMEQEKRDEDREDNGSVRLSFGALKQLDGTAVDPEQIDLDTVTVSPHLAPRRVHIHAGQGNDLGDQRLRRDDLDDEGCVKDTSHAVVEVPREALLQRLQYLQPSAPLKAGHTIEIRVYAKLKDSTPVSALFEAKIVDEHDGDDKRHHGTR